MIGDSPLSTDTQAASVDGNDEDTNNKTEDGEGVVYQTARSVMAPSRIGSEKLGATRTARYGHGAVKQLPQTDEQVSHSGLFGFLGMLLATILGWFGIKIQPRRKRQ